MTTFLSSELNTEYNPWLLSRRPLSSERMAMYTPYPAVMGWTILTLVDMYMYIVYKFIYIWSMWMFHDKDTPLI